MLKDFYCAYHHQQIITQFCQCSNCLLPVCSTCMGLHTKQHSKSLFTQPKYVQIKSVYQQIDQQLQDVTTRTESLMSKLEKIQELRKDQQQEIRKQVKIHRQRIIENVENALVKLQRHIMKSVGEGDQIFVQQLERLDDRLLEIQQSVKSVNRQIRSQVGSLSMLIEYFHDSFFKNAMDELEAIEEDADQLSSISYRLDAYKQKFDELGSSIIKSLLIQIC